MSFATTQFRAGTTTEFTQANYGLRSSSRCLEHTVSSLLIPLRGCLIPLSLHNRPVSLFYLSPEAHPQWKICAQECSLKVLHQKANRDEGCLELRAMFYMHVWMVV
jgi:hypothetical protein